MKKVILLVVLACLFLLGFSQDTARYTSKKQEVITDIPRLDTIVHENVTVTMYKNGNDKILVFNQGEDSAFYIAGEVVGTDQSTNGDSTVIYYELTKKRDGEKYTLALLFAGENLVILGLGNSEKSWLFYLDPIDDKKNQVQTK